MKIKHLSFFILLIVLIAKQSSAQKFADKKFYLIDSLMTSEVSTQNKMFLDSCLNLFHKAKEDSTKIKIINSIVENCYDDNVWPKYNLWILNFVQNKLNSNPKSSATNYLKIQLAAAYNNLGYQYMNQGETFLALKYYDKSLSIRLEIKDENGLANSYNNLALIYYEKGDLPMALDFFHKSLKIREKIGIKEEIADSYNNIAYIHYNQGDTTLAIKYWKNGLKIYTQINDNKGKATAYNNIGMLYKEQNKLDLALEYLKKSLELREKIGEKETIAISLQNVGSLYQQKGNTSTALDFFNRSLILKEEIGDKKGIANSLTIIGQTELENGLVKQAKEKGEKALKIAKEVGYIDQIERAANLLYKVAQKLGTYKEALEMRNLQISMTDSIANEKNIKATAQQQAKYDYEKQKALNDAEQNKKDAIAIEEKQKQQIIIYSVSAGLVLFFLLALFILRGYKQKQKANIIITEQKKIVEEKHKEITDSINYAERIQRSFLATTEILDNNLKDYFVFFKPKDVVSGDFYWAAKLNNNNFAFSVADSTGHGVPGAIMSILNISSLEKSIENENEPHKILNETRKTIINRLKKDGSAEGGKDGMDCSLLVFNPDKTKLTFAAANNPVFIVRNNELIEFKPDKMPVGKHDKDSESFTLQTTDLQKGDIIYTLTDGFADQFGGQSSKKYMIKNLKSLFLSIATMSMLEQQQKLASEFISWKGENEQVDDVCVIGVRV